MVDRFGNEIIPLESPKEMAVYEPTMKMTQAIGLFKLVMEFTKNAMTEGINNDYATIPGTGKPALLKPGAEKLTIWFNLIPDPFITNTEKINDGDKVILSVDTTVILRDRNGNIRGMCQGNCNSGEDKYREQTRWLTEKKLKEQGLTPEGLEFEDRDGNWGKYRVYKVVGNNNPYQLLNTLKKMSQKRAFVGAVLMATGTSGIFTQDIEEENTSGHTEPKQEMSKADTKKASGEKIDLGELRAKCKEMLTKCIDVDAIGKDLEDTWVEKIGKAKTAKELDSILSSLTGFYDQQTGNK
jgi:hypothetical protein